MLMCNDVMLAEGEATVQMGEGPVQVKVLVLTCELIGNAGEVQFVLPFDVGLRGLKDKVDDFYKKTFGIHIVHGSVEDAVNNGGDLPQTG